jgi:hypothetical protein
LNSAGVLAQTEPLTPATPTRNSGSDQTILVVDYPFTVTTVWEDGGSTLLSLNLQWDQGTAGVTWVTLIGESPYSTSDSYSVQLATDGSAVGTLYKFRVRALNIHGWSAYSSTADVLAADVPGVIASTTIAIVSEASV